MRPVKIFEWIELGLLISSIGFAYAWLEITEKNHSYAYCTIYTRSIINGGSEKICSIGIMYVFTKWKND